MANEEVLGPRKTMIVLVIVVGCFAVLWPRILSPLVMGGSGQSLQPNHYDREAGCCEVLYESEIAVLDILNEVCSAAVQSDGRLSPYAAAECRRAVNETCGLDIAAFLKRSENVGKNTKILLETMKSSNSSCLKEHFGVPVLSLTNHIAFSWLEEKDTIKQERSPLRVGPHPAMRERGRAIPAHLPSPPAPPARPATLPPHIRVRPSPLNVYYEQYQQFEQSEPDAKVKPPPIPGMRPPLGGAGGPVQAPKSSMGFVMPIYTICIIVFFVYTLSKILFKRTGTSYEHVSPDPQFRRRVFRDDSRSSPDKLGPKERDTRDIELEALRARLAETERAMQRIVSQLAERDADVQDNNARPYTNGTIIHSGPVQIVASEYRDPSKEKSPEPQKEEPLPEPKRPEKEPTLDQNDSEPAQNEKEPEPNEKEREQNEKEPEQNENEPEQNEKEPEQKESDQESLAKERLERSQTPERTQSPVEELAKDPTEELIRLTEKVEEKTDSLAKLTDEFLSVEKNRVLVTPEKQSTAELLEEALKEDSPVKKEEEEDEEEYEEEEEEEEDEEIEEPERNSVKVLGMEMTAHTADGRAWPHSAPPPTPQPARPTHEAETVQSIYLNTEIPQQSRVLIADFADNTNKPTSAKHSPMVVSGKMTLSLIQDAPRDTPDRDLESTTMDDYTTASAVTQGAAEKEDNLSDDEEVDEEIEVEEIEEEISEEEEEEPKKPEKK